MPSARSAAAAAATALALLLAGCTPSPTPADTATPSAAPATGLVSASPSPAPETVSPSPAEDPQALTIDITIADGKVTPNGETVAAAVGQQITLVVTSDVDEELHAHTSGEGYELAVQAGETASGSFSIAQPGRYEVETHELGLTVLILNVR